MIDTKRVNITAESPYPLRCNHFPAGPGSEVLFYDLFYISE
ncbi:uncharacterized protein RAG0_10303 [Rhynchosporium agropyri]|uniref:Uncharacterized protein n=2 Tax=Rhynchosporium TaxID=38037 RepID=A0A1E1MTU4_RHYSE|nr:uncharacterized protein RAG0_10303 [Rhynchosporium agropyri]CZT52506.1 uncharacterized protein RSE6_13851 [Rhynchosporium secalis]